MTARPRLRRMPQDVLPVVNADLARPGVRFPGIDKDDRPRAEQIRREVESRRADVDELDTFGRLVGRLEHADDERSKAIVAHQHVSQTKDPDHNAFTFAISVPSTSTVWMAHARQGSKECTVRISSSGRCGSATGLPTSDAS